MESEIPEMVVLLEDDGEVACVENCELDNNNLSSLLKNELDKTNSEDISSLAMELGAETDENEEEKCTKASGNGEAESTLKQPLLSLENSLTLDDIGSCSFSAASTPPSPMIFSGSVQCCNDISLRSNSTTSTTSFAFPTLATEWGESPIRMAEVDTTRPRRSRGNTNWRMWFTCSHF